MADLISREAALASVRYEPELQGFLEDRAGMEACEDGEWINDKAISALPAIDPMQDPRVLALVEALELTVRADNLRETYHALPNDRSRIGDKKSRKSLARDAWLRAFRKASSTARATLTELKGESHE